MRNPGCLTRGVLLVLFTAAAAAAHAQWWNPSDPTPPARWGTEFAPKVKYTRQTVDAAHGAIHDAFWNREDFQKIERMYEEFMRDGIRATDGTWMVEPVAKFSADLGLSDTPITRGVLARWAQKFPQSKLLPLVDAAKLQGQAWAARGNDFASAVPGEGMQIFRERLLLAAKALQAAEPQGKESPIWYWVALTVAGSSGQPRPAFDALFKEGVTRFPYYQPLYRARMNFLLPQWGGSFDEVDRFIAQAVERTSQKEGDAFYAWLYMDVSIKLDGDLFKDTRATWPKMKKGFEDMVARYPDTWNRNLFATFACRVRDKETTARLLTELGAEAKLGMYSPGVTTESCRRFALTTT